MMRIVLIAAIVWFFQGCAPKLSEPEVYSLHPEGGKIAPTMERKVYVEAKVDKQYAYRVFTPRVKIRKISPETRDFCYERDMQRVEQSGSRSVWRYDFTARYDDCLRMHYGDDLEAYVTLPYKEKNGTALKRLSKRCRFGLHAPLEVFSFDGVKRSQGWQALGYAVMDETESFAPARLEWDAAVNWPRPLDAERSGAICLLLEASVLDAAPSALPPQRRHWSVELRSGEIGERQRPRRVTVRVRTDAQNLYLQGILAYRRSDGQIVRYRATEGGSRNAEAVFAAIEPGEWRQIDFLFPTPRFFNGTLLYYALRIFGDFDRLEEDDGKRVCVDYIEPLFWD